MHFIHDVCESICLLCSYKPFLLKLKFLLCVYLLISDFILVNPAFASALTSPGRQEQGDPTSRAKMNQTSPSQHPKQDHSHDVARNAKCRKLFAKLEKNRQNICVKDEPSPQSSRTVFSKPTSLKPGEKAYHLLMQKKLKSQCEVPGYFDDPVKDDNKMFNVSASAFNFFHKAIQSPDELDSKTEEGENEHPSSSERNRNRTTVSVDEVCTELFSNTSDYKLEESPNSQYDENIENFLKSTRLPFCGAYNIMVENSDTFYSGKRVKNEQTEPSFYETCWNNVDQKLSLFDILAERLNSEPKQDQSGAFSNDLYSEPGEFISPPEEPRRFSLKFNKYNCQKVLHRLLLKDYEASASFYALFVPALARFDCRVQSDYSVDAYCFSCAVSTSMKNSSTTF